MDKGDDKERKEPENELQQLLEYTRVNVTLRTHLFQEKIISREENDMLVLSKSIYIHISSFRIFN